MSEASKDYGKGHFLIANPILPDPNFSRTVVLLCNHDDQGSFGLVINRSAPISTKEVFEEMGEAQYFSGQKIITEGDPPDFIFIIKKGEVSITKKKFLFKTVELGKLLPGDIFGETAMLSYGPRTATCTATKKTTCFLMFKSTFHYMIKYHPEFKKHVENLSAQRTLGRKTK